MLNFGCFATFPIFSHQSGPNSFLTANLAVLLFSYQSGPDRRTTNDEDDKQSTTGSARRNNFRWSNLATQDTWIGDSWREEGCGP